MAPGALRHKGAMGLLPHFFVIGTLPNLLRMVLVPGSGRPLLSGVSIGVYSRAEAVLVTAK